MGASQSDRLGSVRNVFEALGSNTINEMLGVRRCTHWKVYIHGEHSNALGLAPQSCSVSRRKRGRRAEREPVDVDDDDLASEKQAASAVKLMRTLDDHADAAVEMVLRHEAAEDVEDEKKKAASDAESVATELVRALASNRTVERLYLGTRSCSRGLLLELAHSLKSNSTLRSLELQVCDFPAVEDNDEEAVCKAIAESGCLCQLKVVLDIWRGKVEQDLGTKIRDALRCNREAADLATQLGQVCRLDVAPGVSAKWKCAAFRLSLVSYWRAPSALPAHVKARALRL
eukprot:TRINITY_DN50083_c0_g1_i1.p1 TRINITY_DN50083_c0_g1~~TRINITY_DN50083_c0_g1_i1.p1  ORF type:complete len:287 (+),score=48.13 TRINITY_DN50083_c0_g1_i1:39-899(+)